MAYKIGKKCESCSEERIRKGVIRKDLTYLICEVCAHCELEVIGDSQNEFEKAQEQYFGHGSILDKNVMSPMDKEVLKERLKVIGRVLDPACSLIEVGPGSGFLSNALKNMGYRLKAIEQSITLSNGLRERFGLDIINGALEQIDFENNTFSGFLSFHVIEHVPDPLAHLKKCFEVVRLGGYGFIATPNAGSWQQRFFERYSPNFDEAHLRVFSNSSLARYCELAGWEIVMRSTPEYTSDWLRVVTKVFRRIKAEDESSTAGKYANVTSTSMITLYFALRILISPLRLMQRLFLGGNELFFVLRKPLKN